MNWYIASFKDDLAPGASIFPPVDQETLCIANSHELAVACWRYTLPPPALTYFRVQPHQVYEGEPTPVSEIPGLFRCHLVKIIGKVHDGTGAITGGIVGGPHWPNENLWPLVNMTRWPDDSPMYDDQGYVINWPDSSRPDEQTMVKVLRERQYLLPTFVKSQLEQIRPGRFQGWPVWGPPHS
jgi:hypothetical protein